MFDQDQTFLSNILLHKQMFDRLATSANKTSLSGKKKPTRNQIRGSLHIAETKMVVKEPEN